MSPDFPWNDDSMDGFPAHPAYNTRPVGWLPPMDIYETSTHVVVIAELPGVHHDDIRICFNHGNLVISGSKKKKLTDTKVGSYYRVECSYGTFKRSFRVISEIDKENMDATFDAGILTVLMPKVLKKSNGGES